jgi:hypothetical protein
MNSVSLTFHLLLAYLADDVAAAGFTGGGEIHVAYQFRRSVQIFNCTYSYEQVFFEPLPCETSEDDVTLEIKKDRK